MTEDKTRNWRLEQLLYKQKMKQVVEYGALFDECVEALGAGTVLLSVTKVKGYMMSSKFISIHTLVSDRLDENKIPKYQ
ncbi:hypothetical protein [Paenibacillus sp. V4I5]|uniref:hypothetical protein n=1 Tax=Paenibacillus sp. V4I5 TaxID=3042306 RepID=UPI00278F2C75|nr:hypothetical protein [Paenibacillus sp. V4I5]MDQ0920475.1 hypothetical protein [Paenibacillus sp. V4I5]